MHVPYVELKLASLGEIQIINAEPMTIEVQSARSVPTVKPRIEAGSRIQARARRRRRRVVWEGVWGVPLPTGGGVCGGSIALSC